jgi:hypothetical protein
MKTLIAIIIMMITLCSCSITGRMGSPEVDMTDLELVRHDDFNTFDWWGVGSNWGGWWVLSHPIKPCCRYVQPVVTDGVAIFQPRIEPKDGYPYAIAKINSYPFMQKYGCWTFRFKINQGHGTRHAIWGWADSNETPKPPSLYREIDFIEVDEYGKMKINVHYGFRIKGKSEQIGPIYLNALKPGEWQVMDFKWTPDEMSWYVDGKRVYKMTNKRVLKWFNENPSGIWTMLDQDIIGPVGMHPGSMIVDYISIYRLKEYSISIFQ